MENKRFDSDDVTSTDEIDDGAVETDSVEPDVPAAVDDLRHGLLVKIGGWTGIAAVGAAVLFVGSLIFASTALQPYLSDRAEVASKQDVARVAAAAVTTLWTYTPETIDQLADRSDDYLTGDFRAEYRNFLDSVVLPNKRAQITDTTDVVGVSVESLDGSDAVALVFTNTKASSPMTQNTPALKYVAYRLEMKHEGASWRVDSMTTVSFIDMTPQL